MLSFRLLLLACTTYLEVDGFIQPWTVSTPSTPTVWCRRARLPVQLSLEGDFDPEAEWTAPEEGPAKQIRAFHKFTRPHTIHGTILASIVGTIRAVLDTPGSISTVDWGDLLPRALLGMLALLLGNAFIVGINQIYDKEIDEVNKPFLPIASGEMSSEAAWFIVASSAMLGLVLVYHFFPPLLFHLYVVGMTLGGFYSVPPIRLKQNPILAGLTIAVVRGFLLNFGVYYATKDAIGAPFEWSPKVSFIARFMTVFAAVIAVTKDLPDVEGDKAFEIPTFASQVGVDKMARYASLCLLGNYIHAIATAVLAEPGVFRILPMVGGHIALAAVLCTRFQQLNSESMASVKSFYKSIWELFYWEYILYLLI